jgi:hypothetical protein
MKRGGRLAMTLAALLLPTMGALATGEAAENQALREAFDAVFPPGKQICFMRA